MRQSHVVCSALWVFLALCAPSATAQDVVAQGVTVSIPGGLLPSAQTLKVPQVSAPPPPIFQGLSSGGAYEVQLGGLHQFDQELTLRMQYDPATLRTDLPIERLLSAGYWDTTQKIWVATPAMIDQVKNEVVVKTKHLSMFRWT